MTIHNTVKRYCIAAASGVIFAAGLALGGMMEPRKVQGFLDLGGIGAGRWDASLAFVMAGALTVAVIAFRRHKAGSVSWLNEPIRLPNRRDIDARLVVGAALFGIGWGISGYCPGPALASLLMGGLDVVFFATAMVAGMWMARRAMGKASPVEPD
jgi:uncharacterized protein